MFRLALVVLVCVASSVPALAQRKPAAVVPRPMYSVFYAADRPYLRRGYCHGDFQLCDMQGGT